MIYPVDVSQLLYSERCISERTLDEMEILDCSLDEKKPILLTAICAAVSSDHKSLKILAKVLFKFEEMRSLGNKIFSEYSKNYM